MIAECIGGHALASVCRLLAEDHAGWSGDPPDSATRGNLHQHLLTGAKCSGLPGSSMRSCLKMVPACVALRVFYGSTAGHFPNQGP